MARNPPSNNSNMPSNIKNMPNPVKPTPIFCKSVNHIYLGNCMAIVVEVENALQKQETLVKSKRTVRVYSAQNQRIPLIKC